MLCVLCFEWHDVSPETIKLILIFGYKNVDMMFHQKPFKMVLIFGYKNVDMMFHQETIKMILILVL